MSEFDIYEQAAAKNPDTADAYRTLHTKSRTWSAVIFNKIRSLEAELAAAQSELERVRAENAHLKGLLRRYRNEVPTGNQPHMIVHHVDEALQEPTNDK